jgi:hypothetical protein
VNLLPFDGMHILFRIAQGAIRSSEVAKVGYAFIEIEGVASLKA